jgi:cation transport regulator ChaC
LLYHILNGAIAVFALWLIVINGAVNETLIDQVKNVLAAGLGSMLIMRSKLFNIKANGEDVSFGPDQIIKIYFRFMQSAIDRVRAIDRIKFVKEELENKAYEHAKVYSLTMLHAAQALEDEKRKKFDDSVKDIDSQQKLDGQLKSYRLGFALLNTMGEDFVRTLFEKWKPQWQIQAPLPQQVPSLLSRLNPFAAKDEDLPYLAYGSSMSSKRFVERLNWTGIEESTLTNLMKSTACVLPDHRIAFNKSDHAGAGATGLPNLVPDIGAKVEGVLYRLPKDVIEFLDKTETGYKRKKVTVVSEGNKLVEVETYFAERTTDGLQPNQEFLKLAIAGAEEHNLSADYVNSLRSLAQP